MSELIHPYRGHRTKQAVMARIARHLVPKYPEALSHDVGRPKHAPERLNRLIEAVNAGEKAWYVHSDLQKLAGGVSEAAARQLAQKLVARNVLRRLGRGLYGQPDASQPSPISLAKHVDWACKWPKPFLAFSSAMKLHDASGPLSEGDVVVVAPWPVRPTQLTPTLRLVRTCACVEWTHAVQLYDIPGFGQMRATTSLYTALNGLTHPLLCGGFEHVVGFVSRHSHAWTDEELLKARDHVPMNVLWRLGWLLERQGRAMSKKLLPKADARLRRPSKLAAKGANGGRIDRRWWIRVNVDLAAPTRRDGA